MRWYAGTSGYSYKQWKGVFYPEDLASDDMLAYYAQQLPAVEINNTFYRMPRSSVLEKWAAAVPDDFRFVIKASRRITHQQQLKEAEESTGYLADKVQALGAKLGAVLFQLPPHVRCDPERLSAFLAHWPRDLPAAMEFRHASWFQPEIFELLAEAGAALCISEDGKLELPERIATTHWIYLRLRKPGYDDKALNGWLQRALASGATEGFAFFKHEDEGAGPALASRFLHLTETSNLEARVRKAPRSTARRKAPAKRKTGPRAG